MIRINRRSSSEIPQVRHGWPVSPAPLERRWSPRFAPPPLPSYLVSTTAGSKVGHAPHAVATKKGHATAVKSRPANSQRWRR